MLKIRRLQRGKLLYKLLLLLLILSVVPLFLVGTNLVRLAQRYLEEETLRVQTGIAQRAADNVEGFIENIKNILFVIHKPADFIAMQTERQREILNNLMNAYPIFMEISIFDLKGNERLRISRFKTHEQVPLPEKNFLQTTLRDGEYIGPVLHSPVGNYPVITIAVPIEAYVGKSVGVISAVVNLIGLSSLIDDIRIGQTGYAFVVDNQGMIIAHPQQEVVLEENNQKAAQEVTLLKKIFQPGKSKGGSEYLHPFLKEKFLGAYAVLRRVPWNVVVEQPVREAYRAAFLMQRQVYQFLFLILTITVVLGFVFTRRLVRPIKILEQETEKIARGDFECAVVETNDEIGELSHKFKSMADALKEKTQQLLSAQGELRRWNLELEKRVDERTRELREAQEQLIKQERLAAIGQMASVVGHELRNPLGVINNSIYYLGTKLGMSDDAKLLKHLKIIEKEIENANKIVSDILAFSRTRELRPVSMNINGLLEEIFSAIPIPENIQIVKNFDSQISSGLFDIDELRQALLNLINNAFQAMSDNGGTLTVTTSLLRDAKEVLEIKIADAGCGIPPENREKIFTPFFTTKSKGTGLGMAVVKKVVDRHNGQIALESQLGRGTTFILTFPFQKAGAGDV